MDGILKEMNDFESLLKSRSLKKPLSLYTSNEYRNELLDSSRKCKISAKEVLTCVSRQVKALQNADTASYKQVGNILDKYKKREFLPVDMMPVERVVPQKQLTKFETQCITDTQLINVIENAEIFDKHRGVTQEFDKTFCQNSEHDNDDKLNHSRLKSDSKTDTGIGPTIISIDSTVLQEQDGLDDQGGKLFENSDLVTCEMDTITCYQNDMMTDLNECQETQGFDKCVEILSVTEIDGHRPASPVLNSNRKSDTSPLVVDLYAFEEFENLANTILEEQEDLTVAKEMINSQIIGREILIPAHNYDNYGRDSPVLSKVGCITTNLNEDDVERLCTCSNNCINKDVKCLNEITTEKNIIPYENKRTQSKIIKTELKDEILFSSDEEYEYLHRNIQELPLTCALETSFYDKSDVLDKTMYVGFQTASNKSIQIKTDSFTKAKSLLSGIDNDGTETTLSDLVEIFDTGKAASENIRNVKLTSNELESSTDTQTSSKIELGDENLIQSENFHKFQENRDDTFENVSLTALERDSVADDDIAMSQIINFKNTSKYLELDSIGHSIKSEANIRDTFDNVGLTVLEQNKEIDDDIIMSQVIIFKSISKTPNRAPGVSHESSKCKVFAKRKLEGFKTASNKRIKLSEKALARCKSVFQDIDLSDSEYMSSNSNFTGTEQIDEHFKSHGFNIYNDESRVSYKLDPISKQGENDISDNVASTKMIPKDCESEINFIVKENPPGNEAVDLQINDQIILQEFEENEMPLIESNDNARYKNIAVSDVAIAATKNTIQDKLSVMPRIASDITMKTDDTGADGNDNSESVFKKPGLEFPKAATKRTNPSTGNLTHVRNDKPDVIPQKQEKDDERRDTQKASTEFIGFKTASHKEIVISEKTREKVKDFYRDVDKEITLNVNVDGATNSKSGEKHGSNVEGEFNCGIDTQDFLADELTYIEELFKDNIVENIKPSPIFQHLQTANRKEIVISEKALEKSKKLFEDITSKDADSMHHLTKENVEESAVAEKIEKQQIIENSDNESQFKKVLANCNNGCTNKTQIFTGFQTASNKKLCVSKKGLEATKTLFQDIIILPDENNEQFKPYEIANNEEDNSETHKQEIIHGTKIFQSNQDDFLIENHTMLTDNSKSAITTNINIEAPKRAGFKTDTAKPILISTEDRTKRLFTEFKVKDDDLNDLGCGSTSDPNPSTSRFVGFQTASNKKINISAKAYAKSKQLLDTFELKDQNNDNDYHGNKNTDNLDGHFRNESIRFKENDTVNELCKPSSSKFVGFQTASNKAVKISNEALTRSKKLFEDVDIFHKECGKENTSPVFKAFETASKKKDSISEKALDHSKKLFDDTPVFQGFQTASNKKVSISEKALKNSKKLFQDFNLSQLNKDPDEPVPSNDVNCIKKVTNFVKDQNGSIDGPTASNKPFKVSDHNLATAKDSLEEQDSDGSTLVFRGFQTASNRQVKISEKALTKSKKIFEDINFSQFNTVRDTAFDSNGKVNNDSPPVFKGFQTASNKQVKISEKALVKSKKLFEDINLNQFNTDAKTLVQTETSNDVEDPSDSLRASNRKIMVAKSNNIHIDKEHVVDVNNKAPVFKGFQTASNKNVAVSEKALAKSKKLFEDINLSQIEATVNNFHCAKKDGVISKIKEPVTVQEYRNNVGDIQTAGNNKVNISEKALAKTKYMSKDIQEDQENQTKVILLKNGEIKTPDLTANVDLIFSKNNYCSPVASKIENINDVNKDVIDTQVLNDFESTVNTEDFCKSTPVSKRSGSPILSCPRAKKRKFATPYRTTKKIEPRNPFVPPKLAKTYNFSDGYKKHKKYTLKEIERLEKEHTKVDIDSCISEYTLDSLLDFVFKDERNDYTDGKMSVKDVEKTFLDSVNKKIVPEGWLDNHIKLIIWKLLSYEVKFPNVMNNTCTVRNVLEQLKYRYDKELYHVQRPILRKILEKDEVPSKTMVLCVAAIYVDNVSVTSVSPSSQNVELLVSDGWYCVKACLDRMLMNLVARGSIVVGTKIAVCGAELINCEQGVAPWKDTSCVRLKLHGNSTRLARWQTRLGARGALPAAALHAARAAGGLLARLRLALARVYPPASVERMDDGSTGDWTHTALHAARAAGGLLARLRLALARVYPPASVERMDDGSTGDWTHTALHAARAAGGLLARLRLALARVYPPASVERMDDGSTGDWTHTALHAARAAGGLLARLRLALARVYPPASVERMHDGSTGDWTHTALHAARAAGGLLARLRLALARVYPPASVERMHDGSTGDWTHTALHAARAAGGLLARLRLALARVYPPASVERMHDGSTGDWTHTALHAARAAGGLLARLRLALARVYPPASVERMHDGSTGDWTHTALHAARAAGGLLARLRLALARVYPPASVERMHDGSTGDWTHTALHAARAAGGLLARLRLALARVYPPASVERMHDGSTGDWTHTALHAARAAGGLLARLRLALARVYPPASVERMHDGSTGDWTHTALHAARAAGGLLARLRLALARVYPPASVERMHDGSTGDWTHTALHAARAAGGLLARLRLALARVYPPASVERMHDGSTGDWTHTALHAARAAGGLLARLRLALARVYPPASVERMHDGSTGDWTHTALHAARAAGGLLARLRLALARVYPPASVERMHDGSTGDWTHTALHAARAAGGLLARLRLALARVYPPASVERMHDGSTGDWTHTALHAARAAGGLLARLRLALARVYPPASVERMHDGSTGDWTHTALHAARAAGGLLARLRLALARVYPPASVERMHDGSTGDWTHTALHAARAAGGLLARLRLALARVYPPASVERMHDGSTGDWTHTALHAARAAGGLLARLRLALARVYPPASVERMHDGSTGDWTHTALHAARAAGGLLARLRLALARVYPPASVERMHDGSTGDWTHTALHAARAAGGLLARLRLALARVYPPASVERMHDGSTGDWTHTALHAARAAGGLLARLRLALARVYPPASVERMHDGSTGDWTHTALHAARAAGGLLARLRLALARVYPPASVERMHDGSTVTLSERLENIRQMKYESERQALMEKLYEEVEKEMSDLESQDSEGCSNEKGLESGSQIAKCMKRSKDPNEYRSHLTKSQSRMLEDHNSVQREKLADRVRERFQEKLNKHGLKTERNVVQLLKVRVADFTEKAGSVQVTKGYLSIWRPSAAVMELMTEGAWIEVLNVIPTGIRNSEIQLSTGRQTVFNPYKQKNEKLKLYANTLQRKCYEIKEIAQNPNMTTDYNEIDTVGMIFSIEPPNKEFHEQSFQNVYLADADKNIICVNFWGGLKKFGYENVLDTGQVITCVNLQKRAGNTRNCIPQYRVTEFSYFTKTPKSKKALEITNELTNKLSKIKDKFCDDCIILKNNYSIFKTRNNENISPYRFEYNIPKNIVSPLGCDANLNLTGLDFESSFNSQDISPQALLRKKKVNEKIEKLRLNYGEPPPLSSIHIINKSKNASATYKSPLISNLERSENPLQNVASPLNRTFVKKVNPVKLDFSNEFNESVDDFAEDFDASPPLSLDSDVVNK